MRECIRSHFGSRPVCSRAGCDHTASQAVMSHRGMGGCELVMGGAAGPHPDPCRTPSGPLPDPIRTPAGPMPDPAGPPRLPDKVASRYRHPTVVVTSAGGGGGGGIGDFFLRLVSRGFPFQVASRRFPPALYLHLITGAPAPPSVRADCPRRPACLHACLPVCLSACSVRENSHCQWEEETKKTRKGPWLRS
jgi:hypothetical protein